MISPLRPLLQLSHAIREWPVASQQHARRNAMLALTACADRRAEREDVARFFAERASGRATSAVATTPVAHA